jgi:hypothetical protein
MSQYESGCIALYEAAAAGLPVLLPTLPWATGVYQHARDKQFVPIKPPRFLAARLRKFYDEAHRRPGHTFPVPSWREIARRYIEIYDLVLSKKSVRTHLASPTENFTSKVQSSA